MTEPVFYPDGPPASHVEINGAVQIGPAKLTGAFGTRFDVRNWGHMTYWVDVVDVEGGRLTMHDSASYEDAIVEAENCGRDWRVEVRDLVVLK